LSAPSRSRVDRSNRTRLLDLGAVALELGRVALDLRVAPFEVGALFVAAAEPELRRRVVALRGSVVRSGGFAVTGGTVDATLYTGSPAP
jgi:hypothetical protein